MHVVTFFRILLAKILGNDQKWSWTAKDSQEWPWNCGKWRITHGPSAYHGTPSICHGKHAFCQPNFGKIQVVTAKYVILSSEEAWQMSNSLKQGTYTVPSDGLPWNWCGWRMNTCWRKSDTQNGPGWHQNDVFDAFWWSMESWCNIRTLENHSRWGTPKLRDSQWLTVRQPMHIWPTDRSKTCFNDWICPQY